VSGERSECRKAFVVVSAVVHCPDQLIVEALVAQKDGAFG
jgi:hypothetical protein